MLIGSDHLLGRTSAFGTRELVVSDIHEECLDVFLSSCQVSEFIQRRNRSVEAFLSSQYIESKELDFVLADIVLFFECNAKKFRCHLALQYRRTILKLLAV